MADDSSTSTLPHQFLTSESMFRHGLDTKVASHVRPSVHRQAKLCAKLREGQTAPQTSKQERRPRRKRLLFLLYGLFLSSSLVSPPNHIGIVLRLAQHARTSAFASASHYTIHT